MSRMRAMPTQLTFASPGEVYVRRVAIAVMELVFSSPGGAQNSNPTPRAHAGRKRTGSDLSWLMNADSTQVLALELA